MYRKVEIDKQLATKFEWTFKENKIKEGSNRKFNCICITGFSFKCREMIVIVGQILGGMFKSLINLMIISLSNRRNYRT